MDDPRVHFLLCTRWQLAHRAAIRTAVRGAATYVCTVAPPWVLQKVCVMLHTGAHEAADLLRSLRRGAWKPYTASHAAYSVIYRARVRDARQAALATGSTVRAVVGFDTPLDVLWGAFAAAGAQHDLSLPDFDGPACAAPAGLPTTYYSYWEPVEVLLRVQEHTSKPPAGESAAWSVTGKADSPAVEFVPGGAPAVKSRYDAATGTLVTLLRLRLMFAMTRGGAAGAPRPVDKRVRPGSMGVSATLVAHRNGAVAGIMRTAPFRCATRTRALRKDAFLGTMQPWEHFRFAGGEYVEVAAQPKPWTVKQRKLAS